MKYLAIILCFCIIGGVVGRYMDNAYKLRAKEIEKQNIPLRDYQIELDNDSIYIFDGTREVGASKWQPNCEIDSILLRDNL